MDAGGLAQRYGVNRHRIFDMYRRGNFLNFEQLCWGGGRRQRRNGAFDGSGFEKFAEFKALESLDRETPFGKCSEGLKKGLVDGKEVLFLPRHGLHHDLLPTEVNYRANIFAGR